MPGSNRRINLLRSTILLQARQCHERNQSSQQAFWSQRQRSQVKSTFLQGGCQAQASNVLFRLSEVMERSYLNTQQRGVSKGYEGSDEGYGIFHLQRDAEVGRVWWKGERGA